MTPFRHDVLVLGTGVFGLICGALLGDILVFLLSAAVLVLEVTA